MAKRHARLDTFTKSYVEAALWSSTDDDGTPLDENYSEIDIAPETLRQMQKDAAAFQYYHRRDLREAAARGESADQAGYDFWLTREGHGTGFWDRGLGDVGDRLTDAAHAYGSFDLYIGDDGKIYAQ